MLAPEDRISARLANPRLTLITEEDLAKWYSGKALGVMREVVLPTLDAAVTLGCWPKNASRKVKAALNKQAPAIRWGKENEGGLRSIVALDGTTGWYLSFAMQFGNFALAPSNVDLAQRLAPYASDDQMEVLAVAAAWARCFAPVADLVSLLDSRRPRPTYEFKTLSPTVAANVSRVIGVDLTTVRSPEIEWEWVEIEVNGRKMNICRGKILWPDDTRHGLSRFSGGDLHCHACGHVIRNATNWVPLLFDADHPRLGVGPASLWVGKDCARKLLSCEVSGDAVYEGRGAA